MASALPTHMKNGGAEAFDKDRHHGKSQSHVVSFNQLFPVNEMWQEEVFTATITASGQHTPAEMVNTPVHHRHHRPPSPPAAPASGADAAEASHWPVMHPFRLYQLQVCINATSTSTTFCRGFCLGGASHHGAPTFRQEHLLNSHRTHKPQARPVPARSHRSWPALAPRLRQYCRKPLRESYRTRRALGTWTDVSFLPTGFREYLHLGGSLPDAQCAQQPRGYGRGPKGEAGSWRQLLITA